MDRTLILVKPDAFARGLTGEIIARFERKGLRIAALKLHDARPRDWPRSTTPSTRAAVLRRARRRSSPAARSSRWCSRATRRSTAARQVIGATNPLEAAPGSIRGDFAHRGRPEHGPRLGLAESAEREADLFFPELPAAGPRLALAAAARDPRAAGRRLRGRARRRRGADRGRPARGRARERAPQGAAAAAAPRRRCVLGVDTLVALDGRDLGKPRDAAQARETLRRLAGRDPRGRQRASRSLATARVADGVEVTGSRSARSTSRDRRLVRRAPGSGAGAPAATRSRAAARRWCADRRATTSTSSACRCARC